MPTTITLPQVDLKEWQVVKQISCELVLHDTHIQFIEKGYANSKNEDTQIFEEVKVNMDLVHLKSYVSGACVLYNHSEAKSYLRVGLNGTKDDWVIYFDSHKEAVEVRDKILEWLLQ